MPPVSLNHFHARLRYGSSTGCRFCVGCGSVGLDATCTSLAVSPPWVWCGAANGQFKRGAMGTRGRESILCNRQAGRCGCRSGLEESYDKSFLSEERAKEYQPLLESDVSCVYPHIARIKSSSFASLFCIIALLGCSLCSAESCNYVIEPNLPDF